MGSIKGNKGILGQLSATPSCFLSLSSALGSRHGFSRPRDHCLPFLPSLHVISSVTSFLPDLRQSPKRQGTQRHQRYIVWCPVLQRPLVAYIHVGVRLSPFRGLISVYNKYLTLLSPNIQSLDLNRPTLFYFILFLFCRHFTVSFANAIVLLYSFP